MDEHLDPTHEISFETVKERSIKGVVTLTGRYFILYFVTLVAQLFLAAFLTPAEFGVFGVVSAVINFLTYFSDIGLAASLIQKKEKPSEEDLKTTFTVQQFLVIFLLTTLFLFSGRIKSFYHLSGEASLLLYALGFSFLLSSFRTIPTVLLERSLRFERIAVASILENLVYNLLLVLLAARGFGLNSFTVAVTGRAIVGFIAIYAFQPWKPGILISRESLKKLLKFGLPYQLNTFIALVKDDGLTLVLGRIIGLEGVGFLIWAQKWAQMPLRLFMDTVTKVTFPAFARLQDEKASLARLATRSIFFITFLVFPAIIGLVILSPLAIQLVPAYAKWTPALAALAFFGVNALFASFTTQITNLLNAIGKIKITFFLMLMWGALAWILIPFLASAFGVNGAALGYALVGASSVVAVYIGKKDVNFSLGDSIYKPLVAAILMGSVLIILRQALPLSFYSLSLLVLIGIVVYGVLIVAIIGASIVSDVKKSLKIFFKLN